MEALEYAEPPLNILFPMTSFFLALHIASWTLNQRFSCGILGQILVGTIWGEPVSSWLPLNAQRTIVNMGYIGLTLLVYEGNPSKNETQKMQVD